MSQTKTMRWQGLTKAPVELVQDRFADAESWTTEWSEQTRGYLAGIVGLVNRVDIPDVSINLPDVSEAGLSVLSPGPPPVPPSPSDTMPTLPSPGQLASVSIRLSDYPSFDVPDIDLPPVQEPDVRLPDAPGGAPEFGEIRIPSVPNYTLPDVPRLEEIELPTIDSVDFPDFDAEDRPSVHDLPAPPAELYFTPPDEEFRSDVADRLKARLLFEEARGGTGMGQEYDDALG